MRIYTGNFANLAKYQAAGLCPISIALYPPQWYRGLNYFPLCPPARILAIQDIADYTVAYNAMLHKLDPENVRAGLELMAQGKDIVLMCFEASTKFCHRQLVTAWMRNFWTADPYIAGEWAAPEAQQSLF